MIPIFGGLRTNVTHLPTRGDWASVQVSVTKRNSSVSSCHPSHKPLFQGKPVSMLSHPPRPYTCIQATTVGSGFPENHSTLSRPISAEAFLP